MKKFVGLSVLLLIMSISLFGCGSAEKTETAGTDTKTETRNSYTLLVYLDGSDLESENSAATDDLAEMMSIGSQENVNVVVETGGTKKWYTEGISNKENQRWLIHEGEMELVDSFKKTNMGDPATLSNFLTWGVETYPADRYAVVFWDHGGGSVYGFGSDELFDNDSITLDELAVALEETKQTTDQQFELVGFDACLMSTVETASLLTPYANYMVASQELEPGHGWNYTSILQALQENPSITGDTLGKAIANGFMAQAKEYNTADQITLAVTDLKKIPAVVKELNTFSKQVTTNFSTEQQEVVGFGQARAKSREFSDTGMVDLANLANEAEYEKLSKNLKKSISEAIIYKVASPAYTDVQGLSVYFPVNNTDSDELSYYDDLGFSKEYNGLLNSYYKENEDQTSISFNDENSGISTEEDKDGNTLFEVLMTEGDASKVAGLYSIIGTYEDDRLIYLGIDNNVEFDEETGIINDTFTWSTMTLEDSYVSIFFDHETDDYARYTIPVILNDQEVELIVFYDYTKVDEEGYAYAKIIGAWSGIDSETGLAARELIPIEKGDTITPLLYYYDATNDEEGYLEGDSFVVKKKLGLYETELDAGEYVYGFYAEDYMGNTAHSELYEMTMEE